MIRRLLAPAIVMVALASCGPAETDAERAQRLQIAEENAATESAYREEVDALQDQVGGYWFLAIVAAGLAYWGFLGLARQSQERLARLSPLEKQLADERRGVSDHERAIEGARVQTIGDLALAERLENEAKDLFAQRRAKEAGSS